MTNPDPIVKKTTNLINNPCKVSYSNHTCNQLSSWIVHAIKDPNPFWVQFSYFVILSLLGFLTLKTLEFKTLSFRPRDIDLFFTAVSAVTVSSMSTLDMEVFSNTQLIVLTFLMFAGGEVFVSMLTLQFRKIKHKDENIASREHEKRSFRGRQCLINIGFKGRDIGSTSDSESNVPSFECSVELGVSSNNFKAIPKKYLNEKFLMYEANRTLGYVVLCYILVIHFIGFIFVFIYITSNHGIRSILINKGLNKHTFSLFITVSTFANCGFVPTNENMTIFKKNSGLLLILIPQILLGSTLYPLVLRLIIIVLEKITKRIEFGYMLKNPKQMNYDQLLPKLQSFYMGVTAIGLILVQLVVFCYIEWHNMEAMVDLSVYEKVVGCFFQVVNTRYAGEAVFDLSKISPAILVGFLVMMYLPPLTIYFPVDQDDETNERRDENKCFVDYFLVSQLTYLIIFTILVCFTERKKMGTDPLNFSLFNIVFEVFSAYGNVGLSMCYSCQRQIKHEENCKEEWYGFAGRWTDTGKYLLILVMFFGRLKSFNKNGGRFWNVL